MKTGIICTQALLCVMIQQVLIEHYCICNFIEVCMCILVYVCMSVIF